MVGDCYVEGIMHGQVVDWDEKDAHRFILVWPEIDRSQMLTSKRRYVGNRGLSLNIIFSLAFLLTPLF